VHKFLSQLFVMGLLLWVMSEVLRSRPVVHPSAPEGSIVRYVTCHLLGVTLWVLAVLAALSV
jgi:hypothetical protein